MSELVKDRTAWLTLMNRIERAFACRADAEDALQSAFLRLEAYRTRVTVENPTAFLVRSSLNGGIDQRRRGRVRGEMNDRQAALDDLIDEAPLQDTTLIARERLTRVMAALDRLSPRSREVFLMNRVDELKYAEIADRLGISVSAVEKHMAKAILHLTRARRSLG